LKDRDPDIRAAALRANVKVHSSVKESLPALIEALHDPQVSVRRTAADIIGQIGDKETDKVVPALSPLVSLLMSTEDRTFALEALRSAHVRDSATIEQALAIPFADAKLWACERAAKLGPKGKPLIEKLKPLLSDGNDYVRRAARKAIDQLGR
jgi:HEAT repeat protein